MVDDPNRPKLEQKAADLRSAIATFAATDTNGDHKLSGPEVATALVKDWAARHAGEPEPLKSLTNLLNTIRNHGFDLKPGQERIQVDRDMQVRAALNLQRAQEELEGILPKVSNKLVQALDTNAREAAVTDAKLRAVAEAEALKAQDVADAAAERKATFGELHKQVEQSSPGAAQPPQMQELQREMETGQVSPEKRKQQMAALAPTIVRADKNAQTQAPAMAAEINDATEQTIADMRASMLETIGKLPPAMQKQQMAALEQMTAQLRAAGQAQAKQMPQILQRGMAEVQKARADGEQEYMNPTAKPPELSPELHKEIRQLQGKLAEYRPENVATPTIEDLAAAVNKQMTTQKRER